ncbi:MAG: hypothetical protein WC505_07695 [Patescibacteria group bacterium]
MSLDMWLSAVVDLGGPEPFRTTIWDANITHNLAPMLDSAGPYWQHIARDSEGQTGADIREDVIKLLAELEAYPDLYKQHNPANGWGNYENCINFLSSLLKAINQHPRAVITLSR